MKQALSYLEVAILVRELKSLIGMRIEKVYHPSKDELVLLFRSSNKILLNICLPKYIFVSEYKKEFPEIPSNFCMLLRKYLNNLKLLDLEQVPFERIIMFKFGINEVELILIVELFSKGNIILCDKERNILFPLKVQIWKDREIKPKILYKLPPSKNLSELSLNNFKKVVSEAETDQIVKAIAIALGTGGTYAEEICKRAEVTKSKSLNSINSVEWERLYRAFKEMLDKAFSGEIKPAIIFKDDLILDAVPFEMKIYEDFKAVKVESFNKALDMLFVSTVKNEAYQNKERELNEQIKKQKEILESHKNYEKELREKAEKIKQQADFIMNSWMELDEFMKKIKEARSKGLSWDEIVKQFKLAKGKGLLGIIYEILPNEDIIILNSELKPKLNLSKSLMENVNNLYEEAKKIEAKLPGVEKAIKDVEEEIRKLEAKRSKIESLITNKMPQKIIKEDKEWYEKFVWTITSNGFLAIGGKDAVQNEVLIKKYVEPKDIIFHTDSPGSPFFVMKRGIDSKDVDKLEVATSTLCNSKAWKTGTISEVYWVLPEQISKTAPSGEYVPKGAFIINGKKNYIKGLSMRYGVGLTKEMKLFAGEPELVKKKTIYMVTLIPGKYSKDEIAKKIKEIFIKVCKEEEKAAIQNLKLEYIKEYCLTNSQILSLR